MLLRRAAAAILLLFATFACAQNEQSRHFTFRYAFTVNTQEQLGKEFRLWIPLAHSDPYQEVRVVRVSGDLALHREREAVHGNEMLYAAAVAGKPQYRFAVDYDIVRREHVVLGVERRPAHGRLRLTAAERRRFLAADRLVPVTGRPAEMAAQATAGKNTVLEKARAIYDYVLANMRYDKSGSGWGRGDVLYACDARRGNCTDFHSLFIAMARSQGIPARFQIGFPLPEEHAGEVAGYHCWAEFFLDGTGWVPVDASEAWQHPEKRDYFFGAHDANRVQFTEGRDLLLWPRQAGAPLNYFVYPYVEVAGRTFGNVSLEFSFADVPGAGQLGGR